MGPRGETLTSLEKRYYLQLLEVAKSSLKPVALTSVQPESSLSPVTSPTLDWGVGGEVSAVTLKGFPSRDILPSLVLREAWTASL